MPRLFGTDGIRLIANSELTADLAYGLGRAAVVALTEGGEGRPRIAVGRDTRASGEFLEAALAAGICSAGGDAVLLGIATTPSVAFLTADLRVEFLRSAEVGTLSAHGWVVRRTRRVVNARRVGRKSGTGDLEGTRACCRVTLCAGLRPTG